MKYWVFQNNQVNGPYEPDDLSQLPGFSAETLVCPEGRKGTNMGDWQRAGMACELSVSLLKASQLTASLKGGPQGGVYASLPPEPTLRDLAALGSLQEKVSLLDGAVSQLQETLRLKEDELLSLHRELEEKSRYAQELALKLGGLEEKVSSVGKLQERLDETAAAEQDVKSTVKEQSRTIEELTRQIQGLKSEIGQKEAQAPLDISRFQPREAREAAKPAPEPRPRLELPPIPLSPEPKPFPAALEPSSGPPIPAPPASKLPAPPAPIPAPEIPLPAAPLPFSSMPAAAKAAAPQIVAGPPASSGGKGKGPLGILILAAAGGFAAFQQGLIPLGKKARAPVEMSETAPLPVPETPATEVNLPPQTPEEQQEQAKQAAMLAVKNWPLAGGGNTIGQALEAGSPAGGGISPWMADSIKDDLYQVNFYARKTAGREAQTYEFQVRLSDKQVTAHNAAARELLSSKPAATSPPAPRRGARRKTPEAQEGPILDDLITAPTEDEAGAAPAAALTAPLIKPKKKAQAPRDASRELDELISGAPAPAAKAKPKAKEPEALDQILLPGIPKKAAPEEPQAQPLSGQGRASPKEAGPPKTKKPASKSKAADAELLEELLEP